MNLEKFVFCRMRNEKIRSIDVHLHGFFDFNERQSIERFWLDIESFLPEEFMEVKDICTVHRISEEIEEYNRTMPWALLNYKSPYLFSLSEIAMQIPPNLIDKVDFVVIKDHIKFERQNNDFLLNVSLLKRKI